MDYLYSDSILLIFCKAPVPGQVKTRLMPDLNAEQAASAHVELTKMTIARAFGKPLCRVNLYCSPDPGHPFFARCAEEYPLTLAGQNGGDLGDRMLAALTDALKHYSHAVLIGCDCPSLTASDLEQAFEALHQGYDSVFGPAEDGGYVLVGLNEAQPSLFYNIQWGTKTVMAETRKRLTEAKLKTYELPVQWDVDDINGWHRWLNSANPTHTNAQS